MSVKLFAREAVYQERGRVALPDGVALTIHLLLTVLLVCEGKASHRR
jgi:hypothetical protein